MDLTFSELRQKDIINIADGRKLGKMADAVMSASGKLIGVIVPSNQRFFKGNDQDLFVPWCNLRKIGDDVILVELGAVPTPSLLDVVR